MRSGSFFSSRVAIRTTASRVSTAMPAEDAEGRKQLAGTMLRAPMSLEKMTYDAATGTVI